MLPEVTGVEVDPAAVLEVWLEDHFYNSCRTLRLYKPVKDKRGSVPVNSGCKEGSSLLKQHSPAWYKPTGYAKGQFRLGRFNTQHRSDILRSARGEGVGQHVHASRQRIRPLVLNDYGVTNKVSRRNKYTSLCIKAQRVPEWKELGLECTCLELLW